MIVESFIVFLSSFWCFEMVYFVYDMFNSYREEELLIENPRKVVRMVPPKGLPNLNRKRINPKKRKYAKYQLNQSETPSGKENVDK